VTEWLRPWDSATLAYWRIVFASYRYDEVAALKALCARAEAERKLSPHRPQSGLDSEGGGA
jgi:hypothetical protein